MKPINVGLLGIGTVGGGTFGVLARNRDEIERRAGRGIRITRVADKDLARARSLVAACTPAGEAAAQVGDDAFAVVRDPDIDIVVELIGGYGIAKELMLEAIAHGKHVVTANKALLALHGNEIFGAAQARGVMVAFEAAVGGGIPIIKALREGLTANRIEWIAGIINGTSNFILTAMADKGMSYADALAEAQRLGYAEADPTLDVDGSDAAHKLAILAQLAFGVTVTLADIEREGIDGLNAMDLRFANELGYTVKLLAEAWLDGREVALHVAPVLLRHTDMLAQVRGAFNAIQIKGDAVGEVLFQGPGAGELPTASSVVADIIDIAVGRAQRTFSASKLWTGSAQGFVLRPSQGVRSRFYLRVLVADQPGVLADVARVLADEEISIATVIQHESQEEHPGAVVPLVILTHYAETGRFRTALNKLNQLAGVVSPGVSYSVDD